MPIVCSCTEADIRDAKASHRIRVTLAEIRPLSLVGVSCELGRRPGAHFEALAIFLASHLHRVAFQIVIPALFLDEHVQCYSEAIGVIKASQSKDQTVSRIELPEQARPAVATETALEEARRAIPP